MLRIIAGKYRHLVIDAPNISSTRPTTDKVREALMSALRDNIEESVVLDLFAGSGALGIEALSRGAKKAIFCDNNIQAFKTIKKNIEKLKINEEALVILGDYKSCLKKMVLLEEKLDIVFLDPPYAYKKVYKEVIDFLFENELLTDKAIVVCECDTLVEEDKRFSKHRSYRYGMINVLIERR